MVLTTQKTLWTQIFMHCWGFKKQASWSKHWCLVIDLNLTAHPSSPRCRNYEPLFSSLSVEYSVLSVWYSSSVWLSNCIPEIITWPMKESKFQEFQEAWSMKQEKDQTWIRKWQSKDNKGRGLETFVIFYQPCSHRLPNKGCFLLSLQLPSSMVQHLLITLNNMGINIVW